MVSTTWENRPKPLSTVQILAAIGAVSAAFSLVMGALLVFVIPGACTFLGGLELILLAMLFIAGMITFGVCKLIQRHQRRKAFAA